MSKIAATASGLPNTFVQVGILSSSRCRRRGLQAWPEARGNRGVRDGIFLAIRLPRRHHQGASSRAQPRDGESFCLGDPTHVDRQGPDVGTRRATGWDALGEFDKGSDLNVLPRGG